MTKISTYLAGAAVAAVTAIAAIQPASALVVANGSLTLVAVPGGNVTVDTGNITLGTSTKTEPGLLVNVVIGDLTSAISPGDAVALNNSTLPIPAGVGNPVSGLNIVVTISGIEFTFTNAVTNGRVGIDVTTTPPTAGSFALQYDGTLTNGGGVFDTGTKTTLSESCTQSASGGVAGLISCTNSLVVGAGGVVPEPASLSILGAALLGFGLLRRRRAQS